MRFENLSSDDLKEIIRSLPVPTNAILNGLLKPPPSVLYHYTNAKAVLGILSSGELHASHVLFMNDSSELQYGIKLYSDFLNGPHEFKEFREFQAGFLPAENEILQKTVVYLSCFSAVKDDLHQWRAYGSPGSGYALGFEGTQLGRFRRFVENDVTYSAVVYDRKEQEARLSHFVYSVFRDVESAKNSGRKLSDVEVYVLRLFIQDALHMILICTKDPHFHHEREWRLFFRSSSGNDDAHPEFRVSESGVIVPFCRLVNGGLLPIGEIVIGPSSNFNIEKLGLRKLLRRCGYELVSIKKSEIPLRST